MGRGTQALTKLPPKRRLYGDGEFHIRPVYQGRDDLDREQYFFLIRPAYPEYIEEGYLVMLEGEFGMGEGSYKQEQKWARRGDYKHTRYVYYQEEYENATEEQKKLMKRWATDGAF